MKIGVFGGTFDPPHNGHIRAAAGARSALGLDRLLLIPDRTPPHKALSPDSACPEDRLEMTRLAAAGLPDCAVSDMELRREGASYTVDTLRRLKEEYPEAELTLIMGSDMLRSFPRWREPEEILKLARVAAFPRAAEDDLSACCNSGALEGYFGGRLTILDMEPVEISSTYLRKILAAGAGLEYIDPSAAEYISRKGLYRTGAPTETLEQLRAWAYPCLKENRVAHVTGCEKEAARLAERWGGDEKTVRRAAILHDTTKILSYKEQLKMCERYGILTDNAVLGAEKLLHSVTGAFVADRILGESPRVVSAIRWHTTGKADMNMDEKIVFMADYIEENRDFPGVDTLRELAYKDLSEAMIFGLELTMAEVSEKGRPIHESTMAAYRFLKGNV